MKRFTFLILPLLLAGCASTQTKSTQIYNLTNLTEVRQFIATGGDVNQSDRHGRTSLHMAAISAPDTVPILLNAGAQVNAQDKYGFTPLHYAAKHNPDVIRMLLISGADVSIAMKGRFGCTRGNIKKYEDANPYEMAIACHLHKAISIFASFAEESDAWELAMNEHTYQSYHVYLQNYPSGMFKSQAQQRYDTLKQVFMSKLEGNQPCKLKDEGWFYVVGKCQYGLAHQQGEAITPDGQTFKGEFFEGWRKSGQLIVNNELIFDGPFSLGEPHGEGVCRFEGAFEECRMYKGERIGALYKQRIALQSEMQGLRRDIKSLQQTVYRQATYSNSNNRSSASQFSYISDLNSDDKAKRTVSRIKAAVDLIGFFASVALED